MTIYRFKNENDKQNIWNGVNSTHKGNVLNINTWNPNSTSTKNVIHSAQRCLSLDTPPTPNRDRPITSEHPKLCSTDIRELEDEMKAQDLPYKLCGLCMKE